MRAVCWWALPCEGRVLVIDDVITAGTAVREVIAMIESGWRPPGRGGRGPEPTGAGQRVSARRSRSWSRNTMIPVLSIIDMSHIIDYLEAGGDGMAKSLAAMREYRDSYGV